LGYQGFVETLCYPFVGESELLATGIGEDQSALTALANPLSDEAGLLRHTLLPGLLAAARRNLSRGAEGVALYEMGLVFKPKGTGVNAIRPGVDGPPSRDQLQKLDATLPDQPQHVAAIIVGTPVGQGVGEHPVEPWRRVIMAARAVASTVQTPVSVAPADAPMPWHPGRTAQLVVAGEVVGYAGELHPRVITAWELPPRSAAMELDLERLVAMGEGVVSAPPVWTFPVVKEDVALIVDEQISSASVAEALRSGGGPLLESVRFFDEYRGSQIPVGRKSLAFALRFRAEDRTLDDAEVASARQAAVAAAAEACDALLREA